MKTFQLEVVTPERKVYSGDATMVIVKGIEGELGIMANHLPFVTPLQIAPVRIKTPDQDEHVIAVNGGFIEVHNNKVIILAESAELPEEIDIDRAERARERAEERLRRAKQEKIDYHRAEMALQRAINRLRVAGRGR
ncbi:ATP synthase epsilon chain [Insulibacter thermoxylanivorax]|uniref:ATP synthase epsilon chain n=1 Tax=Insulibacter thermoxylanivorax TaxID=2749268 RepID=A0A916QH67_9BACL|nr:F0F1 ATP synthase subunit epsilon [Insulibacter thermoxylanivorax]GFR39388.1 ATP synthase epsilon chain [Insulibacter thermoxylanivorax]